MTYVDRILQVHVYKECELLDALTLLLLLLLQENMDLLVNELPDGRMVLADSFVLNSFDELFSRPAISDEVRMMNYDTHVTRADSTLSLMIYSI
jgi:hypothetical protein